MLYLLCSMGFFFFAQCPVYEGLPCCLGHSQATCLSGNLSLCDSHNLVTLFTVDGCWGGFQWPATGQSIIGPTPASARESIDQACLFSSEDARGLIFRHHGGKTAQWFWFFILKGGGDLMRNVLPFPTHPLGVLNLGSASSTVVCECV